MYFTVPHASLADLQSYDSYDVLPRPRRSGVASLPPERERPVFPSLCFLGLTFGLGIAWGTTPIFSTDIGTYIQKNTQWSHNLYKGSNFWVHFNFCMVILTVFLV